MTSPVDRRWFMFVLCVVVTAIAWPVSAQAPTANDPYRPAAISTEEAPPVPANVFERMRQYQEVRNATFMGWTEDTSAMLISTRFGNTNQLHLVANPRAMREQITFFAEPAAGRMLPHSEDNAQLLVVMSRGGDENDQIYLFDRRDGKSKLLTDGKSRNTAGPLAEDGSLLVYGSNRRNGRDTDILAVNPRDPESARTLLETDGEFYNLEGLSLDNSKLLVNRYVSINETYPAILNTATGEKTPFPLPPEAAKLPAATKIAFGHLAFAPDGMKTYVSCDARSDFMELAEVDLATGAYRWLTKDIPWDVEDIEVDPNSSLVAFTVNADGASEFYTYDGQQRRVFRIPLGVISGLDFQAGRLGCTFSPPNAPSDAYEINLRDGTIEQWTYSEAGGLNRERFVFPERIRFPSFDSREIPAYYFRAAATGDRRRAPVLIYIHGGPEAQYTPIFNGLMQYLVVEQGLAVIAPNVRGSAGYGKTYLTLDNAEKREDSVRDIGALLDWIGKQPALDSERVAVIGGSYGGYMVLASLVNFPERIRAGVDIVGIGNFITFLERTQPYRQDLRRAEYGDERQPEMRAVFERINPANRVEQIRSALLVAHGKNDPRVPFFEAEQMAARVREKGRPVWKVYAENEGHGFQKKDNRDYLNAVVAMFLEAELAARPD